MLKGRLWPRVSIVTPSFNQAQFIEETIRSVLLQGYPNLEYLVIDGGSTDGSVEIIKKYERWLTYWVSESDRGQAHAINKGFERTTGEILAWINSDDKYCPWAFDVVGSIFSACPQVEWVTSSSGITWGPTGLPTGCGHIDGFSRSGFYLGQNLGSRRYFRGWIQQESTFWRRSLWERAGSQVREDLRYAVDFELWARFWQYAELVTVNIPLGGFRIHGNQKSRLAINEYYREAEAVLRCYSSRRIPWVIIRVRQLLSRGPGRRYLGRPASRLAFDHVSQTWQLQRHRVL